MAHEVDLLLSCGCISLERIEAAIYLPHKGDIRFCTKHDRGVFIKRVGNPYYVDDKKEDEAIKRA
jgi:hypothetical protein